MNRDDFERQYKQYLMFDDPIPFNNVNIYPITMRDYLWFNMFVQSLAIDKNNIIKNDPKAMIKIIKMSYLDFLIYACKNNILDHNFLLYAFILLKKCLHISDDDTLLKVSNREKNNDIKLVKYHIGCSNPNCNNIEFFNTQFDDNNQPQYVCKKCGSLGKIIEGKTSLISSKDFEIIRKIICYQNYVELSEDDITPPALKEKLKEAQEFQNRNSSMGDIEDEIVCLMISTALTLNDIKNMSIRKFIKALNRVNTKMNYQINETAERSGFVKFKEPIKHWMCDLDHQDKYGDVKLDVNQFQSDTGLNIENAKTETNTKE